MKKYLTIIIAIVAAFAITGCGNKTSKEVIKHCKLTTNNTEEKYNLDVEYVLYGNGDYAKKLEIIETVTSSDDSVIEYFDEYLKDTYNKYNELYGSFTNKINKENGKLISNTIMEYDKMDLKKYAEDNSIIKDYVKNDKIMFKGLVELYETLGAVCE